MFQLVEKAVLWMAVLRIFSGSLEIIVAMIILKVNNIEKALAINSTLALVGPLILITTTAIGLLGLVDRISFTKIIWVFIGVACIIYGVRSGN
ncbi:YqhV family protein [Caldibacillus lycopersici]|uniref:YqhV family protein n=1 Tax=Perspicuibacillus lycopersici TaxID=1325689 RepID=A0AAE3LRR3_9BACI|nr:YqhV family protein [Perspicuibacillus lycopersici]MCU9612013.1 YqhV family protein [Perspicuibacillus lycopersici]